MIVVRSHHSWRSYWSTIFVKKDTCQKVDDHLLAYSSFKQSDRYRKGDAMSFYDTWISPLLKDSELVVRILALVVAGIWAYVKFVKGRVFRPRLEIGVVGAAISKRDHTALRISVSAKNVGLARVDISPEGTALRVSVAKEIVPAAILTAQWEHQGTFSIFAEHGWIEPGETISEDQLLMLPKISCDHFLLELFLESGKLVWTARSIIPLLPEEKPQIEMLSTTAPLTAPRSTPKS